MFALRRCIKYSSMSRTGVELDEVDQVFTDALRLHRGHISVAEGRQIVVLDRQGTFVRFHTSHGMSGQLYVKRSAWDAQLQTDLV